MSEQNESSLSIIELPTSITKIEQGMKMFEDLKTKIIKKNVDTQQIDIKDKFGNVIGKKEYIKRSGWRKLAFAFNITDEIIKEEKEVTDNGFTERIHVKVTAPNGRTAVGIGSCSSTERNFAHLEHDVYATAHTRAKNRAISDILGSGEVSFEELEDEEKPTKPALVTTLKKEQSSDLFKFHTAPKS